MDTLSENSIEFHSKKQRVVRELVHGYELAAQLQGLLHDTVSGPPHSMDELIAKILRSFDETLSVLRSCDNRREVSCDESASAGFDGRNSTDSKGRKKRKGAYARNAESQCRTVVSQTLEDGHVWRKYGQKEILDAKYRRNYFRCRYKYDQGCKATKQVQRVEDDPNLYRTTYIGVHTCKRDATIAAPKMIADSDHTDSHPADSDPFVWPEMAKAAVDDTVESVFSDDLIALSNQLFSPAYSCKEFDFGGDFEFDESEFLP